MTTKLLSIKQPIVTQAARTAPDGPISRGLHQRLLALSEKLYRLPAEELVEARKHLRNLFEDAQRVAALEDVVLIPAPERSTVTQKESAPYVF